MVTLLQMLLALQLQRGWMPEMHGLRMWKCFPDVERLSMGLLRYRLLEMPSNDRLRTVYAW